MLERLLGPLVRHAIKRPERPRFLAFLDYAYTPYALGDSITWVENAQVTARDAGVSEIDVVVLATRERPAPSWQPFITPFNYTAHVHGLLPAFLSSPMIRNVHVLENRQTFYDVVSDACDNGAATWPGREAMVEERLDFMSHLYVVDHFRRRGSIPLLAAPPGFDGVATEFMKTHCGDRFRIVINVRQSHLRTAGSHPERDSRFDVWAEFIRRVAAKYDDVVFIVAGQFLDVDRRFSRLPATVVPRSLGYGLGVELALLQGADLFMGTSSGFAQAALFGKPSYIVTNTEPRAAPICGVPVGARHHPFGRPDQVVTWTLETVEELETEFAQLLAVKRDKDQRVPRMKRRVS